MVQSTRRCPCILHGFSPSLQAIRETWTLVSLGCGKFKLDSVLPVECGLPFVLKSAQSPQRNGLCLSESYLCGLVFILSRVRRIVNSMIERTRYLWCQTEQKWWHVQWDQATALWDIFNTWFCTLPIFGYCPKITTFHQVSLGSCCSNSEKNVQVKHFLMSLSPPSPQINFRISMKLKSYWREALLAAISSLLVDCMEGETDEVLCGIDSHLQASLPSAWASVVHMAQNRVGARICLRSLKGDFP